MVDRGDEERLRSIALTWLRLRTVTIPPCRYQTPFLVSPASSALINEPLVSRRITGADWLGAMASAAASADASVAWVDGACVIEASVKAAAVPAGKDDGSRDSTVSEASVAVFEVEVTCDGRRFESLVGGCCKD